jgi:hypothetical protein
VLGQRVAESYLQDECESARAARYLERGVPCSGVLEAAMRFASIAYKHCARHRRLRGGCILGGSPGGPALNVEGRCRRGDNQEGCDYHPQQGSLQGSPAL